MPQQQHPKTASKKRSSDEAWNGCLEKKEKLDSETAGAETTPTKQDKEDGIGMSVELRTEEELTASRYLKDEVRMPKSFFLILLLRSCTRLRSINGRQRTLSEST